MKEWKPALGRTSLKGIAVLTMLCDHMACVLLTDPQWGDLYRFMRMIGRVSFPIFCFVLVQGFLTTSDIRKYISRLFGFAVLSEIPFDLAFSGCFFDWGSQNVIFTLLTGMLVLTGIEKFQTRVWLQGVICFGGCFAAYILNMDYSYFGVALILIFYLFRENAVSKYLFAALLIFSEGGMEVYAMLALPICYCYQPQKREPAMPKYFFYLFYPVHLLVLWGIAFAFSKSI